MKSKTYELRKSAFGFDQNCKVSISNHHDKAVIQVTSAEWPTLINGKKLVAFLVGQCATGDYRIRPTEYDLNSNANGWLDDDIKELEKRIENMKFLQKIARRKLIEVDITKTGK